LIAELFCILSKFPLPLDDELVLPIDELLFLPLNFLSLLTGVRLFI